MPDMLSLLQSIRGQPLGSFPVPPLTQWLNGTLRDAERGRVVIEFEVRPEMANPTGLLHGGMQCAMLDDSIGVACATLGHEGFMLTIDIHVDYIGKVRVGEPVSVEATIVREGSRVVHAQATMRDAAGQTVSIADANLLTTTHKPTYLADPDAGAN